MYKESQVGPDLMDIFQFVLFNYLLHTHLYPSRYAYYEADIPFGSQPHHFFELLRPIPGAGDLLTGFVKRLEPERNFPGRNAAEVARIITGAFLQVGASPDHQPAL